jgi:putative holliday junction resolvase
MAPLKTSASESAPSPGRIMAIDYGRKRFGLALSDELGLTSQPLTTLPRTNRRDDLRRLRLLARENKVRQIVVGLPLRLDGSAGDMAEEVVRFATRITKELGLPVEMFDERLSSWEAGQTEVSSTRSEYHDVHRDEIAAAIILRDYLASRSASARGKE